ncbi:hypothetical protein Clacol_006052 [Clathrus columnatus]|uniref:Uncharacterized protein n=1 Tax=Clathrus columnatus TaxID=1419009 RepID=A0AAV5AGK0_9AGAM|nr:hypothetical protein Clacol_006052 [Clathrus columnatus]
MNDQKFPDIDEGPYNYRFIPHPDMKLIAIHHQIAFPDTETEELKPDHFMFCSYPFENIGWIAAKANDIFLSKYADAHPGLLKSITMILQICNKWTCPLDKNDPKHLSFLQNKINPDDIISENFSRTENGRLKPHLSENHFKKRRNGVKCKQKGSTSNFVSTKKLRILGEQISSDHAIEQKLGNILSWRSNVSDECDNQKVEHNDEKTNDIMTGSDIKMDDS